MRFGVRGAAACFGFGEARLEAPPGTQQTHPKRGRVDPEGLRRLPGCEVLQGHEQEGLAVKPGERAESPVQGRVELVRLRLEARILDLVGRGGGRRRRSRASSKTRFRPWQRARGGDRRPARRRAAATRWSSPRPRSRPHPGSLFSARRQSLRRGARTLRGTAPRRTGDRIGAHARYCRGAARALQAATRSRMGRAGIEPANFGKKSPALPTELPAPLDEEYRGSLAILRGPPPSTSGPGLRPFTAPARVRIPLRATRAVSSAGRAPGLHRGGRRFDPVTAHSGEREGLVGDTWGSRPC